MKRLFSVKLVLFLSLLHFFLAKGEAGQEPGLRLKPMELLLPGGKRLSSIAYSASRGEIYVADSLTGEIRVGKLEGGEFIRLESLEGIEAYAICAGNEGVLFVTDLYGKGVSKLDVRGRVIKRLEITDKKQEISLGRIRVGPQGKVYVVERSGRRVFVIDPELKSFESILLQSSPDTLALVDLTFQENGSLIALSSKGEVVRKYDPSGKYLGGFGKHGFEKESFSLPSACMAGPGGFLWIVDSFQHSVKVYEFSGKFRNALLEMDRTGNGLFFPVDITYLGRGKVAVLDKGTLTVKLFEIEGLGGRQHHDED
ncbi:MAG: hypothetical protein ACE5OP_08235 [Candidatus Glassbacteria bacterium]